MRRVGSEACHDEAQSAKSGRVYDRWRQGVVGRKYYGKLSVTPHWALTCISYGLVYLLPEASSGAILLLSDLGDAYLGTTVDPVGPPNTPRARIRPLCRYKALGSHDGSRYRQQGYFIRLFYRM